MKLFTRQSKRETRLFFVTDIHGSERCFRKFINAAEVHDVDVLLLGGDISGKRIVPVVAIEGGGDPGWRAGKDTLLRSAEELAQFERSVADAGLYAYRTTPDEVAELSEKPELVERAFRSLARERLERWLEVAAERLKGSGTRLLINCGNDDPFELDDVIAASECAVFLEGQLVDIDGRRTLASCGFANLTPWHCPRDVSEEDLTQRIDAAVGKWTNGDSQLILNFHCPPYDSGLDHCAILGEDLAPVVEAGQVVIGPVGSRAVREAIERYQPILSLHGHIHESRGAFKLGPTLAINPGSEYPDGILRGAIVDFDSNGVRGYVLTCG
jgi:uncharacterized protein